MKKVILELEVYTLQEFFDKVKKEGLKTFKNVEIILSENDGTSVGTSGISLFYFKDGIASGFSSVIIERDKYDYMIVVSKSAVSLVFNKDDDMLYSELFLKEEA